jgi:cytochrome c oxidase subunit 3
MNTVTESVDGGSPEWVEPVAIRDLPIDQARGTQAMAWFIASEAMVFAGLFFSYFYLGHLHHQWPPADPPKLALPTAMVLVLLLSCIALWFGDRFLRRGEALFARLALLVTIVLGCGFLVLNSIDYNDHSKVLHPTQNSYTSIFYVTEAVHAAHLILGLLFLLFALVQPQLDPTDRPPHGPYRNAAMYWYFVTAVWLVMYAILFISPHHPVGVYR